MWYNNGRSLGQESAEDQSHRPDTASQTLGKIAAPAEFASSAEPVGPFRLRQSVECVKQSDSHAAGQPEAARFSNGPLVVEPI